MMQDFSFETLYNMTKQMREQEKRVFIVETELKKLKGGT